MLSRSENVSLADIEAERIGEPRERRYRRVGLAVLDAMATTPRIQIVKARAVPALIDGPVEVVRP